MKNIWAAGSRKQGHQAPWFIKLNIVYWDGQWFSRVLGRGLSHHMLPIPLTWGARVSTWHQLLAKQMLYLLFVWNLVVIYVHVFEVWNVWGNIKISFAQRPLVWSENQRLQLVYPTLMLYEKQCPWGKRDDPLCCSLRVYFSQFSSKCFILFVSSLTIPKQMC